MKKLLIKFLTSLIILQNLLKFYHCYFSCPQNILANQKSIQKRIQKNGQCREICSDSETSQITNFIFKLTSINQFSIVPLIGHSGTLNYDNKVKLQRMRFWVTC